jgi:hypothetical protein
MNNLSPAATNARPPEQFVVDLQLLALLHRLIEETKTTITQSRAAIAWSRDAIAMLDRLQGYQISNLDTADPTACKMVERHLTDGAARRLIAEMKGNGSDVWLS